MRKVILLTLLPAAFTLLVGMPTAAAQQITEYRYWFNDDVTTTTVVSLTPTPVADAQLVLNSAALPPGHHLATIQFRDADGHWGAPWTGLFVQRGATVDAIEYWFNDEVADAITANVTPGSAPLI